MWAFMDEADEQASAAAAGVAGTDGLGLCGVLAELLHVVFSSFRPAWSSTVTTSHRWLLRAWNKASLI